MAFNLFVAYDLIKPGQNYKAVQDKIKSLGQWYQPQFSLFYIHTALTPQQVTTAVQSVMDDKDKIAVINADGAVLSPALPTEIAALNKVWFSAAA